MPQTKKQDLIFTLMMVTAMVYGMVIYNIAFAHGGLEYHAFIDAFHELPIMIPIAFALEHFVIGKLAVVDGSFCPEINGAFCQI